MEIETFSTARLTLRKLTPEVYRHVFENYPDEAIQTFLGLASEEELNKEKAKYAQGLATHNRSFVLFQLIDLATSTIIGGCGLHNWVAEHRRAEIGYSLTVESYKRQGIMSEAIVPILDYGFNNMNLHRIEAFIGPQNQASLSLIKKFNFKPEGHLREHYFKNEVMEDSLVFALLRTEYKV